MKNKAKCKLCKSVIESFFADDYIECKCGEIALHGGMAMKCSAKSWDNFIRVQEDGKEVPIKVKNSDKPEIYPEENLNKPTKNELLTHLRILAENIEQLPQNVMTLPVTHYDFLSLILVLEAIFRADCNEAN